MSGPVSRQVTQIRKYVAAMDPLGFGTFAEDEYDGLVRSIINTLNRNGKNIEEARSMLIELISGYSDAAVMLDKQIMATVDQMLEWWQGQPSE